jgi:hypothetical protein
MEGMLGGRNSLVRAFATLDANGNKVWILCPLAHPEPVNFGEWLNQSKTTRRLKR